MKGLMKMEQFLETEQQKLRESLKHFLTAQSLQPLQQQLCDKWGALMQSVDVASWLDGTDSGWNLRLPVCICALKSAPPFWAEGAA